jgi:hypothetical protein
MKKLTAVILSTAILSGCSMGQADSPDKAFRAFYKSADKCVMDGTYGWEAEMQAQRLEFEEGALGCKIFDFDEDGQEEMAVLKIEKSDDDEVYARAYIEMYEYEDKNVVLSDKTESQVAMDKITDAGGTEFFGVGKYLVLQCATQNNSFSDGVTQDIRAYSYNGEAFENELNFQFCGSAMDGSEETDFISDLEKIGLKGCAEKINGQWYNPYFTYDDGLNLAKMETEEIDSLASIYITNNGQDVIDEMTNNENFDDWMNTMVENEVMTVTSKSFYENF